jgi:hypothetical protein
MQNLILTDSICSPQLGERVNEIGIHNCRFFNHKLFGIITFAFHNFIDSNIVCDELILNKILLFFTFPQFKVADLYFVQVYAKRKIVGLASWNMAIFPGFEVLLLN